MHSGRLELTWTNKDKALLSTGDGRYDYTFVDPSDYRVAEVRLLQELGRVEAATPSDRPDGLPTPTHDNLMITGDAMHVLDILAKLPEYAEQYVGKVKLVYIDPPFNTGQAFDNYEDNIEHSVWLTMLRDRLRQIKPLLAEDGSVWVHLDDEEVHRCRVVMDEELGPENFVAEVAWEKADSPNSSATYLSIDQDFILVYAKNKRVWRPNKLPRTAAVDAKYTNPDADPRGRWFGDNLSASKPYSRGTYPITTPSGRVIPGPPAGGYWRISEERLWELDADNRIWWGPDGDQNPKFKRFLADVGGLVPRTLWTKSEVGSNRSAKSEIKALFRGVAPFATPKPERLLHRIIHIATNPGDIVLDCFAGSGTTAAVAHKMGRRWVTSELIAETVETFTLPRLAKVVRGEDPGGITTVSERVAADELPEGMTPQEAREFTRLLNKVAKGSEGLDRNALKQLRAATRTREEKTTLWHGGGSFRHLEVGPSMFTEVAGMVLLAEWATQGDLARAMCAQLGVPYEPDGIFAGRNGRTRYVIVDGMVGVSTVDSILDRLGEGEVVEVLATQFDEDAPSALREARPGSRLDLIPDAVLDSYRRRRSGNKPFAASRVDIAQEVSS